MSDFFKETIFKCIFLNIFLCFRLNVAEVIFNAKQGNNPMLFQVMARHWMGEKPFSPCQCLPIYMTTYGVRTERYVRQNNI